MVYINRRRFLQSAASATTFVSAASSLSLLGQSQAVAQTSDYKALVCLFLLGGLDQADTLIPYDQSSYDQLKSMRQTIFQDYEAVAPSGSDSSRARDSLLELSPVNGSAYGGRAYALPPQMPNMKSLFDQGRAAVIGNVGPLIEPTDRQAFENRTVQLPAKLFSHNDQQSAWMAFAAEGAFLGWGGRFGDAALELFPNQDPRFLTVNAGRTNAFLEGNVVRQFTNNGRLGIEEFLAVEDRALIGGGKRYNEARERLGAYYRNLVTSSPNLFDQDVAQITRRAVDSVEAYMAASATASPLPSGPGFDFPDSPIGNELRAVAETINLRGQLNVNRQVFFTSLSGFDTHSDSVKRLPELQSELDEALGVFINVLDQLGVGQDVVTFTASDFGRTLVENGDGTDHGWGGHQFVIGDAVRGGRFYGDLPDLDIDSSFYTQRAGRLIPSASIDQYASTLGRWFGLEDAQLDAALPNLGNFGSRDLGFLA